MLSPDIITDENKILLYNYENNYEKILIKDNDFLDKNSKQNFDNLIDIIHPKYKKEFLYEICINGYYLRVLNNFEEDNNFLSEKKIKLLNLLYQNIVNNSENMHKFWCKNLEDNQNIVIDIFSKEFQESLLKVIYQAIKHIFHFENMQNIIKNIFNKYPLNENDILKINELASNKNINDKYLIINKNGFLNRLLDIENINYEKIYDYSKIIIKKTNSISKKKEIKLKISKKEFELKVIPISKNLCRFKKQVLEKIENHNIENNNKFHDNKNISNINNVIDYNLKSNLTKNTKKYLEDNNNTNNDNTDHKKDTITNTKEIKKFKLIYFLINILITYINKIILIIKKFMKFIKKTFNSFFS